MAVEFPKHEHVRFAVRNIHIYVHDFKIPAPPGLKAADRRDAADKPTVYYRDVPEGEFSNYQTGKVYQFGSYKGKVIGKRRGPLSGLPQVLVEWTDAKPCDCAECSNGVRG